MVASGFAGLGYQIVWTQQAAVWLGHESAAVLAVVAAFFGGLGVGAFWVAPKVAASLRPGRWYAVCEIVIGAWSLALAWLLAPATELLLAVIGARPSPIAHWLLAFSGTFVLLLPATAAMGATLPALEQALRRSAQRGDSVAALYASNTLGALLGVLGAAFVLIPALGLARTAAVCATLNLLCALVALRFFATPVAPADTAEMTRDPKLAWLLVATGFLGIGYEVLVVRVLSQVAENTVYTFAILLAAYLVGTALGAAAYARASRVERAVSVVADGLVVALAAVCLLGTLSLAGSATLKAWMLALLPPSLASALGAEALIAGLGFLLPTLVMGALFSHLATRARATGLGFGRALGLNTFGAAAAPALFGVLLVPALGTKSALLVVSAAYLLLGSSRLWRRPAAWTTAAAAVALALWLKPLSFIDVPQGGRLVSYGEGVLATVSVVENAQGVATLHINNRQQEGSTATGYADSRQAVLPLLLHAAPQRVLLLGLGTGVTAVAASEESQLDVEAVELVPEVVAASAYFTRRALDQESVDERDAPRGRLVIVAADARRFVRTGSGRYDVIIADNFHPARSGSAALYTVEHFAAVRDRLAAGGVFCQWLPLHQLDLATLRSIVRTFLAVYPDARALLATYSLETPVVGLVASANTDGIDLDHLRGRLRDADGARRRTGPSALGLGDDLAVLGTFVAGPESLARFAADAPLNTDDRPLVSYLAPRLTYAPISKPRDRLLEIVAELSIGPADVLAVSHDGSFDARLIAYWSARDRFLAAGRNVRLSGDVREMLPQVHDSLLDTLRISPEFRPAYDPLLQMALALTSVDPAGARSLLTELQAAQPQRTEAAQALLRLDAH